MRKHAGPKEVGKWLENWKNSWIIVHESGRPQGRGTGAHGVPPRAMEGSLKAHSCR